MQGSSYSSCSQLPNSFLSEIDKQRHKVSLSRSLSNVLFDFEEGDTQIKEIRT